MWPTGWETILLFTTVPLGVITYNNWHFRDAIFTFVSSVVLILLSQSILPAILATVLLTMSFYRLHTLLYIPQTPNLRAQNPTPEPLDGVG
jgi:hypothetical protein